MHSNTARLVGLMILGLAPGLARGQAGSFTLKAESRWPIGQPVLVDAKDLPAAGVYRLAFAEGPPLPAQVVAEGDIKRLAFVPDRDLGKGDLRATLEPSTEAPRDGVRLDANDGGVRVTIAGQPFTDYLANDATKPYLFPVIGPNGKPFTRAHPMKAVDGEDVDHHHQRSFWFTHGDVDGIDFWASDPKNPPKVNYGKIRETSRTILANGPIVGVLKTTDDWLGPDGKALCRDERVARFYGTKDVRVIDFDVIVHALDKPVTFRDTKEGMFGLRVASSLDVNKKAGGKITNAEGITDNAAWGKPSPWVDYTGPIDGETVGIAILNHPSSFRYPTTWHVRDYGLFAANPFGWKDFGMGKPGEHTIAPGESIAFRYRVILHKGDTATAGIADAFHAYGEAGLAR